MLNMQEFVLKDKYNGIKINDSFDIISLLLLLLSRQKNWLAWLSLCNHVRFLCHLRHLVHT